MLPERIVASREMLPAIVTGTMLPPQSVPEAAKAKLREVAIALDPLKLLEEIRAVQAHLVTLADGENVPITIAEPPDLSCFVASLSSAWRGGEVRPTFSIEAKPRYLRSLQHVVQRDVVPMPEETPAVVTLSAAEILPSAPTEKAPERPRLIYARRGTRAFHALKMVWPLVCWRLEACPNITSTQLFEELCAQFPGRFHSWHDRRLMKRVKAWRQEARARGVVIGPRKHRYPVTRARGRGRGPHSCTAHWTEMVQWLEGHPDSTGVELLIEFQARYPGVYSRTHLRTLRRRAGVWRRQTIQRLICEMKGMTQDVTVSAAEQSCAPNRSPLPPPALLPAPRAGSLPALKT